MSPFLNPLFQTLLYAAFILGESLTIDWRGELKLLIRFNSSEYW